MLILLYTLSGKNEKAVELFGGKSKAGFSKGGVGEGLICRDRRSRPRR